MHRNITDEYIQYRNKGKTKHEHDHIFIIKAIANISINNIVEPHAQINEALHCSECRTELTILYFKTKRYACPMCNNILCPNCIDNKVQLKSNELNDNIKEINVCKKCAHLTYNYYNKIHFNELRYNTEKNPITNYYANPKPLKEEITSLLEKYSSAVFEITNNNIAVSLRIRGLNINNDANYMKMFSSLFNTPIESNLIVSESIKTYRESSQHEQGIYRYLEIYKKCINDAPTIKDDTDEGMVIKNIQSSLQENLNKMETMFKNLKKKIVKSELKILKSINFVLLSLKIELNDYAFTVPLQYQIENCLSQIKKDVADRIMIIGINDDDYHKSVSKKIDNKKNKIITLPLSSNINMIIGPKVNEITKKILFELNDFKSGNLYINTFNGLNELAITSSIRTR